MMEFIKYADNDECCFLVVDDDGKYVCGLVDKIVEITDDIEHAIKFYNEESAWGLAMELQCRIYKWFGVEVI